VATASDYMSPAPSAPLGTRPETEAQAQVAAVPYTDFPCSAAQERFWLLDRLEPGNPSYNVAVRWQLQGRVSGSVLEQAWREIIGRHEILRTGFLEVDGKPMQRVSAHSTFKLTEIDLSALSSESRSVEGDHIGLLEARAPFDLSDGPVLRVVLLRYAPTESIILVTTHQIVSDGWSIGVMAREMGTIYAALSRHEAPPLEPLSIQYGDYSLWQLEWLAQRGTEAETGYWTRQLAGIRPFEVLADRPRPAVPTTNGTIVSVVLPRELTARMQTLSADRGVTLYATAVSALCAALGRYTGKDEVVLGTQVSDRDQVELEPMIGQFVSSLILRNDLRGDPTFSGLLERVSTTIAEALEHRHIPIERLLDMVKAGRGGSSSPAVSVNFIFQRTFIEGRNYGDFTLVDLPSLVAGAIYDLNFFMVERPDGWRFSCQFNTDQFEADTANRLLRYVSDAIASAVENPARRVSELRLGDPAELARIGDATVRSATTPPAVTVAGQFSRQVQLTPDAVALVQGHRRLNYAQLHAASLRLAATLQARGIAAGMRVAIGLNPSIERTTAMLAVLNLGAAYIQIDPNDPAQFVQRQLTAAGAKIAFLTAGLALDVSVPGGVITDFVDDPHGPGLPDSITCAPERDAAIVFSVRNPIEPTSVTLSQASLVNLCESLGRRLGITRTDVVAVLCTAPPESGPLDSLLPLLCGASSVLPTENDLRNSTRAAQLIARSGASVIYAEGATWNKLMAALPPGQRLPKVLSRRDTIDAKTASRVLGCAAEFWALHGYPQTGGCTSARHIKHPSDLRLLGAPLDCVKLSVMDERMAIPPIGAMGKLYASGYGIKADAAETDGFVTDSSAGAQNGMLFRTGELARQRPDGTIEVVDDYSHQFAIDEHTFSATSLVNALMADPEIADAAAIATPTAGALRAFVQWQPGLDPVLAAANLRSRIAATWPRAALPGNILAVGTLPRASDGSVDLRRLESEQTGPVPQLQEQAAPDLDMERRLGAIWAELLKIEHIKPNANFFELGGHSLLAARMLGRVEAQFGKRFTLAALFRAPTIRGLSRLLRSENREFDFRQMVKLQSGGSGPPLIAINNTGVYYLLAKRLGPDQPVTSLQLFDPSAKRTDLPDTLEGIAAEYVKLIHRVHPQGPYILMGWCVAGTLAFEIARQLVAAKQNVAQLFLVDSWAPGYFKRLPIFRRLINSFSLRWQLLVDDWRSWRMGRLSKDAFIAGRPTLQWLLRRLPQSRSAKAYAAMEQVDTPENHDRWLLQHLQACNARYEPKAYSGHISLIRSTRELTGWLFDPYAGWAAFANAGVDLRMVQGNHFTMFQDPGVTIMANWMMERIAATTRRPEASVSPTA
jgi:non-ribosomal peptide synthetase component F/thioesterase domain-containing protein